MNLWYVYACMCVSCRRAGTHAWRSEDSIWWAVVAFCLEAASLCCWTSYPVLLLFPQMCTVVSFPWLQRNPIQSVRLACLIPLPDKPFPYISILWSSSLRLHCLWGEGYRCRPWYLPCPWVLEIWTWNLTLRRQLLTDCVTCPSPNLFFYMYIKKSIMWLQWCVLDKAYFPVVHTGNFVPGRDVIGNTVEPLRCGTS